jgi:UDP-2,4-diacetamido-2,4,6-trideoxy-beta-L-altropyranose hydrolase
MVFVFRVDSGFHIGIGHMMRCINLGKELKKLDNNIIFICKNHIGNYADKIKDSFKVYMIDPPFDTTLDQHSWFGSSWEEDASSTMDVVSQILSKYDVIDFLLVDHYCIDYKWEDTMRPYVNNIVVIDDLHNRKHNCDMLIDQNMCDDNVYDNLIPKNCELLLGLKYVILSDRFQNIEPKIHSGKIRRVIITFGGSDFHNLTGWVLEVVKNNKNQISDINQLQFDVIFGSTNINYEKIVSDIHNTKLDKHLNINIYYDINNMDELLQQADMCIGSAGTSTYERLVAGLPTVVITVASNQKGIADKLNEKGLIKHIGYYENVSEHDLIDGMNYYLDNPALIKNLKYSVVDGYGTKRITKKISNL